MWYTYVPKGVCSRKIDFNIEDGVVEECRFTRGCNGNTQGVCPLVEGMPVEEVIRRLSGINCNGRGTSWPDQLSKALKAALEQKA